MTTARAPSTEKAPPEDRITFEEFLAWADEDTHAELIDGKVIMMTPASFQHQQIVKFLATLLDAFVQKHDVGVVVSAPFAVKVSEDRHREPDVLFVANEHLERVKETYVDGPPDIVVEVISPESRGRDWGEKFTDYEGLGVAEYWLIDPLREQANFFVLGDDRLYDEARPDAEGRYASRVLEGFGLDLAWLWRERPPTVAEIVALVDKMSSKGEAS
jgi:Uma2 family endonuclease